jgi:hypothetical protein
MRATLSMLVLAMMVSATGDAGDRTRHFVGNPRTDLFVEHPSVKHGLTDREIPSMVLVEHNQVRYVGD